MDMKRCSKCKIIKPINEFYKKSSNLDGYDSWCKTCNKKNSNNYAKRHRKEAKQRASDWYYTNREKALKVCRKYRKRNAESIKAYKKIWYLKNAERIKEKKRKIYATNPEEINEKIKQYRKNNPEKIKEINKKIYIRRSKDPVYRLNQRISKGIYKSIKGNKHGRHWETLVNFKLQDLIKRLESFFKDGMTWDNYGKWHIDHIRPVSSFNFSSYDDPEFKECWALNNLQPLWAEDNIKKSNKIMKGVNL